MIRNPAAADTTAAESILILGLENLSRQLDVLEEFGVWPLVLSSHLLKRLVGGDHEGKPASRTLLPK